jgi:hypothetical protein
LVGLDLCPLRHGFSDYDDRGGNGNHVREGQAVKYMLSVEVKLQEIPEAPEMPTMRAGDDPIQAIVGVMGVVAAPARPGFMYGQQAGFDFRKQIAIQAEDFAALARTIGKFDALVSEIEFREIMP